jgi:hypothetical protein
MKSWFRLVMCIVLALPAALPGQWAVVYQQPMPRTGSAWSILETPDGGTLVSGFGYLLKLSALGKIVWDKSFNTGGERPWLTRDGGCLVASNDAASGFVAMFKISPSGTVIWQKKYVTADDDIDVCILTPDDGVLMAGNLAGADFFLRKCSPGGEIEWQKSYGTERSEAVSGAATTSDGGYIVIGSSRPPDGSAGSADLWVLKLTSAGEIEWQKLIGGDAEDLGESVHQTADGGYLVAGRSASFNTDGQSQFWLMKLSSTGGIERQVTLAYRYGGDYWLSVHPTADGLFLAALRPAQTGDQGRGVILTISPDGAIIRSKAYTMVSYSSVGISQLEPTTDGGCLLALNGYLGEWNNDRDAQLMKLAPSGEIEWQKIYGSKYSQDGIGCLHQTAGGGYVLGGGTSSWGDMVDAAWVMRLAPDGTINPYCYFIKNSNSEARDEPDLSVEIQAAAEDTLAVPQNVGFTVETGDITFGSGAGVLVTLGKPSCTLTMAPDQGGGTTSPKPGAYTYDAGTVVTLAAFANSHYRFFEWVGNIYLPFNSGVAIVMDGDKRIGAIFQWTGEGDNSGNTRSCFIATAAYGSPSHPHVMILRAFRDRYLVRSRIGRSIADFYYRHSPPLADFIGRHKALKAASRIMLFPAVALSYILLHLGLAPTALLGLMMPAMAWLFLSRRRKRRRAAAD